MTIQSYLHSYDVNYVGGFSFLQEFAHRPDVLAVIDRRVYQLYDTILRGLFDEDHLVLLDALEEEKTVQTALSICEKATGIDAKRNLRIVAIGGGIIQDVASFAAHILYRGVGLVLVPTTLLAQGDSCIGSKNSINFLSGKNLLGTFYPPKQVFVCPDFTDTLTDLDFHSGLGEIVRFRIMDDLANIQLTLESMDALLARDKPVVRDFMEKAHVYKKAMVERDEFDLGPRRIFNYGHTFGHAYEAVTGYAIPHGLAVLLGMVTANRISLARGILEMPAVEGIEAVCRGLYNAGPLPVEDMDGLVDTLKKDKKRQGAGMAAVLLSSGGQFEVVQDIRAQEVREALPYAQAVAGGAAL